MSTTLLFILIILCLLKTANFLFLKSNINSAETNAVEYDRI